MRPEGVPTRRLHVYLGWFLGIKRSINDRGVVVVVMVIAAEIQAFPCNSRSDNYLRCSGCEWQRVWISVDRTGQILIKDLVFFQLDRGANP